MPRLFAPNKALAVALSGMISFAAHAGGIPVVDASNLSQNIMTAMESVSHTLKQIEQYKTQLQQYENQLQNTAAPSKYTWEQAQATMAALRNSIDTLNYYKAQLGGIDNYLGKFQDVNYYKASPCFSATGCSPAEMAAMNSVRDLASESQKKANDALFRGLDKQQNALQTDARTLEQLQTGAQSATGQMQAIGSADQLASQQANQLLQIRGLLIAQQNAVATKMQADADKDARQAAAHAISTESRIGKTTTPKNWLNLVR